MDTTDGIIMVAHSKVLAVVEITHLDVVVQTSTEGMSGILQEQNNMRSVQGIFNYWHNEKAGSTEKQQSRTGSPISN